MSTIKKILSAGFVVAFAVATLIAGASVADAQVSAQVYISNLNLNDSQLNAGDTVSGSFVIQNGSDQALTNVNYRTSLVGGLEPNGLYSFTFDSVTSEQFFLDGNESRTVEFSYKLPESSSAYSSGEQLAVKVKAYSGAGQPFGWDDVAISVADTGLDSVSFLNARITVGDDSFGLNEGPTAREGESVLFTASLESDNGNSVLNLTPRISIYEMDYARSPVSVYEEGEVSVEGTEAVDFQLTLPNFDYTPGVYAGEVVLVDENGINRSNPTRFRYIIAGDIVNIRNVALSQNSAQEGDEIVVDVEYSGATVDIANPEELSGTNENLTFDLTIYNEDGDVIAEYTDSDDFADASGLKTVRVGAMDSAEDFAVEIRITNSDGDLIAEYSTIVGDSENIKSVDQSVEKSPWKKVIWLVLVLIVLGVLLAMVKSKNKKDLLVVLFIFVGTAFAVANTDAFVSTSNYGWQATSNHPKANIYMTFSTPQHGGVYEPGELFRVRGTSFSYTCNNNDNDINIYASPITEEDDSWPSSGTAGQSDYDPTGGMELIDSSSVSHEVACGGYQGGANHAWCTLDNEFASGLYEAPEEEGTYRIYIFGRTTLPTTGSGIVASNEMGYIEFEVACSDPEGCEVEEDADGICRAGAGPFSIFPSVDDFVCDAGEAVEGNHTEDQWIYVCEGTETTSEQCTADRVDGGGGVVETGSVEIDNEDIDPSDDLDSEKDIAAIVNSAADTCTIRWEVDAVGSEGTCTVEGEESGVVGSVEYPDGSYSIAVDPKDEYTVTCTDDSDSDVTDTTETLTCVLNPSIIEQ